MNFFLSSRWSVRLALIIIALLALIALTSQWWLPYDPQAIDLPSRLLSPDAQHSPGLLAVALIRPPCALPICL